MAAPAVGGAMVATVVNDYPAPKLTFVTNAQSVTATNTYLFSGISIGSATSDRIVVVASFVRVNASITVTIDGNSTDELFEVSSAGSNSTMNVSSRPIATGTTADIQLAITGGQRAAIAVFTLTGHGDTGLLSSFTADSGEPSANERSVTISTCDAFLCWGWTNTVGEPLMWYGTHLSEVLEANLVDDPYGAALSNVRQEAAFIVRLAFPSVTTTARAVAVGWIRS